LFGNTQRDALTTVGARQNRQNSPPVVNGSNGPTHDWREHQDLPQASRPPFLPTVKDPPQLTLVGRAAHGAEDIQPAQDICPCCFACPAFPRSSVKRDNQCPCYTAHAARRGDSGTKLSIHAASTSEVTQPETHARDVSKCRATRFAPHQDAPHVGDADQAAGRSSSTRLPENRRCWSRCRGRFQCALRRRERVERVGARHRAVQPGVTEHGDRARPRPHGLSLAGGRIPATAAGGGDAER
jgi:hypothetical protein